MLVAVLARAMIEYKAQATGIIAVPVPLQYTSRDCSRCKNPPRKENRESQAIFCCKNCGYTTNADLNASTNVLNKGLQRLPTGVNTGGPLRWPQHIQPENHPANGLNRITGISRLQPGEDVKKTLHSPKTQNAKIVASASKPSILRNFSVNIQDLHSISAKSMNCRGSCEGKKAC